MLNEKYECGSMFIAVSIKTGQLVRNLLGGTQECACAQNHTCRFRGDIETS